MQQLSCNKVITRSTKTHIASKRANHFAKKIKSSQRWARENANKSQFILQGNLLTWSKLSRHQLSFTSALVGHVEKSKENVFEGDIELTKSDEDVVDTRNTSSEDTADVDVDSIVTKRKAIFSKRHLWVTKEVPLELETTASKITRKFLVR